MTLKLINESQPIPNINHMKKQIPCLVLAVMLFVGVLAGCKNDPIIVSSNNLSFSAKNLSTENDKDYIAYASSATTSISLTITIGDEHTTVTASSDELPVMGGNEIELTFIPKDEHETDATFTMPDGSIYKVTKSTPKFKWSVPDNFKSDMVIKGESEYRIEDVIYKITGNIKLIPIEEK